MQKCISHISSKKHATIYLLVVVVVVEIYANIGIRTTQNDTDTTRQDNTIQHNTMQYNTIQRYIIQAKTARTQMTQTNVISESQQKL